MRATDTLREEHHGIERMLRVLGVFAGKLVAGEQIEPAHLDGMIEFFTVFVDRCHHGKEEDVLFPALEAVGIRREGGPIGILLSEHARGRELVATMDEALQSLRRGDQVAKFTFAAAAQEYHALLLMHIDKENAVLFALAAARLDSDKDTELVQAFARLEDERIGQGVHERFHALLEQMTHQYLQQ